MTSKNNIWVLLVSSSGDNSSNCYCYLGLAIITSAKLSHLTQISQEYEYFSSSISPKIWIFTFLKLLFKTSQPESANLNDWFKAAVSCACFILNLFNCKWYLALIFMKSSRWVGLSKLHWIQKEAMQMCNPNIQLGVTLLFD